MQSGIFAPVFYFGQLFPPSIPAIFCLAFGHSKNELHSSRAAAIAKKFHLLLSKGKIQLLRVKPLRFI